MLTSLRKSAGTWVVRIFLLLLAAAFGVGIWSDPGSLLRDRTGMSVASVGGVDIDPNVFSREYQGDASRARQLLGASFDSDPDVRRTVALGVIERLALRTQFDLEGDRLGLDVSEDLLRRSIIGNPAFQDDTGAFSPEIFAGRIANQGYSEPGFVAVLRAELARSQLLEAVTASATLPATLVERLYAVRAERRVVEVALATTAPIATLEPDDATLKAFYDANTDRYTAPEFRAATYLWVRPETLTDEVAIDDATIQALYEERIDAFQRPERRAVDQIIAPDRGSAAAVAERIKGGETFEAVAESLGQPAAQTALGTLAAADFPLPGLADAVFALAVGEVSEPVQSPLGWHVFRVGAIEPPSVTPFEEAKDALRAELAIEHGADVAYEIANGIEDALAGGASLEDAARDLGLATAVSTPVDASGRAADGATPELPAPADRFVALLFETPADTVAPLEETSEGGFFLLRTDTVTAPAILAFDLVRERVRADWVADALDRAVADAVAQGAVRLAAGEGFDAVAEGLGTTLTRTQPFTRLTGPTEVPFPPDLIERLFQAKVGDIEIARADQATGHLLVRLVAIEAANPAGDPNGVALLRRELEQAAAADLAQAFRGILAERYPIQVRDDTVESLL